MVFGVSVCLTLILHCSVKSAKRRPSEKEFIIIIPGEIIHTGLDSNKCADSVCSKKEAEKLAAEKPASRLAIGDSKQVTMEARVGKIVTPKSIYLNIDPTTVNHCGHLCDRCNGDSFIKMSEDWYQMNDFGVCPVKNCECK